MAFFSSIIFLISLLTFAGDVLSDHPTTTTLYLSPPTTFFSNYNNMLNSFKIFIYPPSLTTTTTNLFTTPQQSQFYKSLLTSPFITQDPNQAHLFFIPFPSSTTTRSLARFIKTIRLAFPFWNRTLGADHFYLSAAGVDSSSDRNIVELKKNSIQISNFPTTSGLFIPHKDITLPPPPFNATSALTKTVSKRIPLRLVKEIENDNEFKVELINNEKVIKFIKNGKFCISVYGYEMTWMVEAMTSECVPVVITDRPIQDLPMMDVIKWDEVAVFVGSSGDVEGLKRVLNGIEKSRYETMVKSGVVAAQHLVWNAEPQAWDAFNMIVYQLWLRRHTIRYARWVQR
ncbi:probable glycosyltransferase At5g20260 [Rutidosis leptorrhynchoides]|uniref:probable glycosyltransferase At5g20260 n=1 Tax=Rutidosis leptorrhynchoides TaxID=125765 RepID=UPI003A98CF06